jgi:hypothetical protein
VPKDKDSYERTDNYDGQGVAVFAYLMLKPAIDSSFNSASPLSTPGLHPHRFIQFQTYPFLLECLLPSLNFLLQDSVSHPNSKTLRRMGLEMSCFLLRMSQQQILS